MCTGSWIGKLSRTCCVFTLLSVMSFAGQGQASAQNDTTNNAAHNNNSQPATQTSATPAPQTGAASPALQTTAPHDANPSAVANNAASGNAPLNSLTNTTVTVSTALPLPKVSAIDTKRAGLGDLVTLRVENLAMLVQQSKCLGVGAGVNCQKQEIILFLNGRPLTNDGPEVLLPEDNLVQFHLSRASGTDDLWEDLLGNPQGFVKEVKASVGLANGFPLEGGQPLELVVVQEWAFWSCFILLAAVILSIIYLARRTSLLRNSNQRRADLKLYPYSLGRTQMAFWFLLVVTSFLLIWLITGEYDAITTSTLVLIGIGAGTALGADLVDSNKLANDESLIAGYRAEAVTLASRIAEIKTALTAMSNQSPTSNSLTPATRDLQPELIATEARLDIVNAALLQLQTQAAPPCSAGFFRDILHDHNGISFHRFQIVVWTIVLGIIFVASVYTHLAMPEFSGTLLALMGISSGTYLGFKGTENK